MKRIIYKVENKQNGYMYIGATTHSIYQRKLDHIERANRGEENKFHKAIRTYGIDTFSWEQIDTANSMDELASKEQYYVLKYSSKEEGYNGDIGGGFKKSVYQYSLLDGRLLFTFENLSRAASSINTTKQHISRACLSVNNEYVGYYWSYDLKDPFFPSKDKRKNKVIQFSLEGIKIDEYGSVAEAFRETGVSKTCISRVCRAERDKSGGFIWKYIK